MFRLTETFYRSWTPRAYAVLRIASGLLVMERGTSKLFEIPYQGPAVKLTALTGVIGLAEAFAGLALALGLASRPAAALLALGMGVSYWRGHADTSPWPLINGGELPVLFFFVPLPRHRRARPLEHGRAAQPRRECKTAGQALSRHSNPATPGLQPTKPKGSKHQ